MADYVPNTTTFALSDVVAVVAPSTNSLGECFADAVAEYFHSSYKGSKDRLSNFRAYDNAYSYDWLGYIRWSYVGDSGTHFTFEAFNAGQTTAKNGLFSNLYWETRDSNGDQLGSGSRGSGVLDIGDYSYPTAFHSGGYDSLWVRVSGGSWIQFA